MSFVVKKYENPNMAKTIRFTQELFDKLSRISAEKNVSFNSLILQCCEYAVEHIEPGSGPEEDKNE